MKQLIKKLLNEKLMLKDWGLYTELVAKAYTDAPDFDPKVVGHWNALNKSNYTLFQRLLSKVNVIFTTKDKSNVGSINILGKEYKIIFMPEEEEYKTQQEMKSSFEKTGVLYITIDFSNHPIFDLKDNIVFRTVHDYIVHILGNHDFSAKGEIASYNRHAKLAPKEAVPAIFTEVVGQAACAVTQGGFPKQKIALLYGFDYYNVGVIDDSNYEVVNKTLIKKSNVQKDKPEDKPEEKKPESPELELAHVLRKRFNLLK